jgi:release factor glutamine methyltransferase
VTLGDLLRAGREALAAAGVASPGLDAALLLCRAAGVSREVLMGYPERRAGAGVEGDYRSFLRRRASREPVSRILGRREFWGLEFVLDRHTLDPRPDTETLVAAALDWLRGRGPARIVDLGTGTGCILLALLAERPDDTGLGIDVSAAALDVAQGNARRLGLDARAAFAAGDWTAGLADATADLLVANPPYIPRADIAGLEPEVALYDPAGALDGGVDGLAAYRAIAAGLPRVLAPGGAAFLEIGPDQAEPVAALLRAAGAAELRTVADLAGRVRCVVGLF